MSAAEDSNAEGANEPEITTKAGWSDADKRMMFITVAGGLAANVGVVLLVGCAVSLIHFLNRHPALKGKDFALVCIVNLGFCIVTWLTNRLSPLDSGVSSRTRRRHRYLLVFNSTLALVLLIALTGLAAGVTK